MFNKLTESLEKCPIVKRGEYNYFIHPVSDGVPIVEPALLREVAVLMIKKLNLEGVTKIVVAEAMGIHIGVALSLMTDIPLTIIRKREYQLEGEIALHQTTGYSKGELYLNGIEKGEKVVVIDDVFSTGGTMKAILEGISRKGAEVADVLVVIKRGECDIGRPYKYLVEIEVTGDGVCVSLTLSSDLLEKIKRSGAETVALQFPEGLKRKASLFSEQLKKEGYRVIISGNPCWGACDLDLEILGQADILVHFGHAPVGEYDRVIYEPYFQEIDTGSLNKVLPHISSGNISVVTTVQHAPQIDEIIEFFRSEGYSCTTGEASERTPYRGQVLGCTYSAAKNTGADEILYIGTGVFHAIGVKLATGIKVTAFDPVTGEIQVIDESKMLRVRFAKIEKARSADNIAIIVSTKSGQRREDLAERLWSLSKRADIVYIKEITPDALLNLGYGAYVNTACPRLAYDDNVRFPAPLLSPEEYEILLGVREWEDYEIDEIVR